MLHTHARTNQQKRLYRQPGQLGLIRGKCVQLTSTRSLSNFTTKVNLVHAKSPHGCGAPSPKPTVSEKGSAPTFTFARARECGCAGSATSWPADREVSVAGVGCDQSDHKLQSLPGKNQFPNTPAPGTARRLLAAGKGPSAGLALAPSPLEQSLEAGRNFPERKRGGRARPAARWAPATAAPQLPERQEAPAPPGRPRPRPRAPQGKRAGSRARREPDSRRGRRGDGAPPA